MSWIWIEYRCIGAVHANMVYIEDQVVVDHLVDSAVIICCFCLLIFEQDSHFFVVSF